VTVAVSVLSLGIGVAAVVETPKEPGGYAFFVFGIAMVSAASTFTAALRVSPMRQESGAGGPLVVIPIASNPISQAISATAMSLFGLLLGAQIVLWMTEREPTLRVLAILMPMSVCGLVFPFFLPGVWRRARSAGNPSWVLSREGLTIPEPTSRSPIHWDDITDLRIVPSYRSRSLMLRTSSDAFNADYRRNWIQRRFGGGPIALVPSAFLGTSLEDVQRIVLRYHDDPDARAELGSAP
jgi:hypothetical protein